MDYGFFNGVSVTGLVQKVCTSVNRHVFENFGIGKPNELIEWLLVWLDLISDQIRNSFFFDGTFRCTLLATMKNNVWQYSWELIQRLNDYIIKRYLLLSSYVCNAYDGKKKYGHVLHETVSCGENVTFCDDGSTAKMSILQPQRHHVRISAERSVSATNDVRAWQTYFKQNERNENKEKHCNVGVCFLSNALVIYCISIFPHLPWPIATEQTIRKPKNAYIAWE